MVVPIILYGSPVLRKYSAEVTEEDDIQKYADDLFNTIRKAEGIGLAAPQINLLKRVFVIDTTPLEDDDLTTEKFSGIFINPEIIYKNSKDIIYREGCLSIPGIFEEVYRPDKIVVRYQDLQLKFHEEELEGITARIFQHEYDHLEGILFIDKINILRKKILSGKLNRIKKLSKT
ncbi:MAG: peptide deformylase [Bacteroidales bacterium]|nr:peptide deformylase [Bacteroidales bacterium]